MLVANVLWAGEHTAFVALADRQEYAFTPSYNLYVQKATPATPFFYIDAKQQLTKRGYSVVSIIFFIKKPQKTRKKCNSKCFVNYFNSLSLTLSTTLAKTVEKLCFCLNIYGHDCTLCAHKGRSGDISGMIGGISNAGTTWGFPVLYTVPTRAMNAALN